MVTENFQAPMRLEPQFQRYAWGDPHFLPALFGKDNAAGEPFAEAWFGAHPMAPSVAVIEGAYIPLDRLIARCPKAIVGADASDRFGGLPYLLKVIAAARPLSIQVHPSRDQAAVGFQSENEAGLPADAAERTFRDPNHKPELLVALTDFDVLCGFRPFDEIARALEALPEVAMALPSFEPSPEGLRRLVEAYFRMANLDQCIQRLIDRLRRENERTPFLPDQPGYWALVADSEFSRPGHPDPGVLFVFLLKMRRLAPGQAVFLDAGVLHSYLRGAGVEVMANSDNVVRCGLTSKRVDVPQLLGIVRYESDAPSPFSGVSANDGEVVYPTPAAEFELARSELRAGHGVGPRRAEGAEVLLVIGETPDLQVTFRSGSYECVIGRGGACLVPDGVTYSVQATSPAALFRARIPQNAV